MVPETRRPLQSLGLTAILLVAASLPAVGQAPSVPSIKALLDGAQRVLGNNLPEIEEVPSEAGPQFTLPISQGATPVEVQNHDGLISLSVRDASLRQVLATLAETQNLNLIVATPADLPVTAEFKRMPLRQVLGALLHSTGHTWTERNGVLTVTSIAAGGGLSPHVQGRRVAVIELDFASAADLQPAVEGLLSAVGQSHFIETNATDNRRTKELLIVEDLDPYVARIEHYLAEADQPPRQVLIEVHLLQVNLEDNQQCGVDFDALSRVSGANLRLGSTGAASAFAYNAPSRGFFIEASGGDLDSVIEALISTTDAKTLASPRLLALNGQTSRMQIGEEIGYLTNLSTQGGGVNQQQAEFLEVGVILNVTPRITRDGRVLMQIAPEVSTGEVNPLTNAPDKQTAELQTNAILNSGQGMIIGGLIQEVDDTRISRVPVLGSLPYINPLFQRREVIKRRSELVVALTPHVLPYADPLVHARNEHDLRRARSPLTHGPLCRTPRPYEPRLYDPYHDERHCRVIDRRDRNCGDYPCTTGCDAICEPPEPYAGPAPRRLPPTLSEDDAPAADRPAVARRPSPTTLRR